MIEITFGKMNVPEEERFIGFAGDNLYSTRTFLLKNVDEENCIYRLYLTFDDGTTNYFLLDSKIENSSTYLTWNISEDHIMKSGIIKAQIKAFCEDERIFHTSYDYFVVAPTAEFDGEISEKENSEFLEYEKRLNEILSYISSYESDFVPNTRTVAGLSLSGDITTELLCSSMKVYPILRLTTAPTNTTAGEIGQLAFEKSSTNGADRVYRLYLCVEAHINGEYVWRNITPNASDTGTGISNVSINTKGELEIHFSDGENKNLGKITGTDGKDGENGTDGKDGVSPHIGANGNWFIDDEDTGVKAEGKDGGSPFVSVTTFSGGVTLDVENVGGGAQTVNIYDGEDGKDGYTPVKGKDYFDGKDGVDGKNGQDGKTPVLGVDYFTDSDKEFIVSSVIDYFGGRPLYGFVDENNRIVVSGNLGNGTYTVKYELEDGTTVDIGELTLGSTSEPDEPEVPDVSNYFNKDTAQLNFRLGSSGSPSAFNGMVTTDFIEYTDDMTGKRFYASGIEPVMSSQYNYNARIVYYDLNKTKVAEFNDSYYNIYDQNVGVLTTYGAFTGNGYIRISLVVKDNVAITSDDVADLSITLK